LFDIGVAQVTVVSAGGAVTPHTQIRDVVVHEEYRNHGAAVLLNDIGTVVGELPPGVA
jgi:predicted GNAT family acetyltransferase